jgi:hypothetical protein
MAAEVKRQAAAGVSSSSSAGAGANAPLVPSAGALNHAYERPGLSREEIAELKEAFDLFDTEGVTLPEL